MNPDVVIGGGPAGAAVAILIARAGQPVTLLERKADAHDKVCGEFISWEAAQYLQDLGVNLPALGAQPIRKLSLYNGGEKLQCALPNTAWSLSRRRLDEALLHKAQQAGAHVLRGVAVRTLNYRDSAWELSTSSSRVAEQEGSRLKTQSAKTVFLASGKHDIRNWQRASSPPGPKSMLGFKMHFQLAHAQQEQLQERVEIYLYDGGYAGLEPIERGKANLCFLIDSERYQACQKQWPKVLEWLTQTSPCLKTRLLGAAAMWPKPLAISGVPYGYQYAPENTQPQLFRLGDQAAVIPSVAGDGIAIALHSAFLAARAHVSGDDAQSYQRLARKDFHAPVRDAQLLTRLLSTESGRRVGFALSRLCPVLLPKVIARLRVRSV